MTLPSQEIQSQSLSDMVIHLRDCGAGLVRYTTQEALEALEHPHEHTNLPIYKVVKVFLSEDDKTNDKPIYMIFVDNGAVHFCDGDVLTHYKLDEDRFFTEDPYNYDEIFETFFLDGGQDLASFAGFFIVR